MSQDDTPLSTGFPTPDTGSNAVSKVGRDGPSHHQVLPTPAVISTTTTASTTATTAATATTASTEMKSVINFQSELIGRTLLLDPNVSKRIDLVARLHGVTVCADVPVYSQAVLSGSPQGVASVHGEISTLTCQVKRDVKAHCMLIPILFSLQAREVLSRISQNYGIEVSLIGPSRTFLPIHCLIKACQQIQLLQKVHVKDYLIPLVSISKFYTWAFMNEHSQLEQLPSTINKLLNNRYSLNIGGQESFQVGDVPYIADLSAMTLIDARSCKAVSLHKEPQPPCWLYSLDEHHRQFLNYVQSEANALESMYCYGGSSITLSGVNNLVEFISMRQVNLDTGKIVSIKRNPPPASNLLPDYDCQLVLTGPPEILDQAVHEFMKQLDPLCTTTDLTCKLSGISQHWQDTVSYTHLTLPTNREV